MIGIIDIHCHLLPGVDDGAPDLETAVALLKKEYADGVRSIIVTPHYRKKMFEPPMDKILENYRILRTHAEKMGIRLYLGCEYHVNTQIVDDIFGGKRPSLAYTRYVLCEFSSLSTASFIRERCAQMISRCLVPVIAHVERYPALMNDKNLMRELSESGCLMQVNAGSLLGKEGLRVKHTCRKLLEEGLIDLVASDCHDLKHRPPLMGECARWMEKKLGRTQARRILRDNPQMILDNR